MDEAALKPDANFLPDDNVLDESEVIETEAIDDAHVQEQEMAALRTTKGWQRIAKQMQEDIDGLRTGEAISFTPDTPMSEVGQKYVVASTVAIRLQTYLNMVNSAAEATYEYEKRRSAQSVEG